MYQEWMNPAMFWTLIVGFPAGLVVCLLYVFWPEIRRSPARNAMKSLSAKPSGLRSEYRSLALGALLIAANAAVWLGFGGKDASDVTPLWLAGTTTLIGGFLIARALVKLSLVSPSWLVIASILIGASVTAVCIKTGHGPDSPTLILIALFYAGLIVASWADRQHP